MSEDRRAPAHPANRPGAAPSWPEAAVSVRGRLVAVARKVVRDSGEAEDVADEAIARLAREFSAGRSVDDTAGWLHRTTLRLAIDRARHWVRRNRPDWLARAAERPSEEVDRTEQEELRDRLWAAVLELPARQREVVVLHQLEGLPYREVGELLGISESTARVHGHAARESLRQRLRA